MSVVAVDDRAAWSRLCGSILRAHSEWFEIEEATAAYIREVAVLPTFAVDEDGFLSLRVHQPRAAEVYVMGVRPERHRAGLGTALLEAAETYVETMTSSICR